VHRDPLPGARYSDFSRKSNKATISSWIVGRNASTAKADALGLRKAGAIDYGTLPGSLGGRHSASACNERQKSFGGWLEI
jgi:hypothetical protein